jgi:hypothetical protein
MDIASQNVVAFLRSLRGARQELGRVGGHYLQRGTQPSRPSLEFHGEGFFLALLIKATDAREYELSVDVLWHPEEGWTISTSAFVEAETGQEVLRELPKRTAADLGACMEQLRAAVGDLIGFQDLVPAKTG